MNLPAIDTMDHIVLHAALGADPSPDDDVRVPDETGRVVDDVLLQYGGPLRPRRRLVLFNRHYLEIDDDVRRRVLNLAYLAPEPLEVREIAWRWLVAGLASAAGTLASAVAGSAVHALLLATMAAACLAVTVTTSRVRQIFRTRTGGIAVIEVNHWPWGRRASRAFAARLMAGIREAGQGSLPPTRRLAAEMAEHRRMLTDGWLSRARYELAKKRILARYQALHVARQSDMQAS